MDSAASRAYRTRTLGEDEGAVGSGWERTAGSSVGPYVLERELGAGAMGVVWEAHDPRLDRSVAIKFTRSERARTPQGRQRFVREARSLARLSNPHVVTVYDFGFDGDDCFLVMERVQGQSLRDWLEAAPRDRDARMDVMLQTARGLTAAHDLGLIHRDFKPENVLVGDDGRARVADFGLAVDFDLESDHDLSDSTTAPQPVAALTGTGAVVGSPAYMAPEQHEAETLDPRTDQYAFCVTLYEVLVGHRPFSGRRYAQLVAAKLDGPESIPRRSLSPSAFEAIGRGLSVRRDDRWPSMRELVAALSHRRRTWPLATFGGIGAVVIASAVAWPTAGEPCSSQGKLEPYWNAESRTAISSALAASGKRHARETSVRVVAALDEHADGWSDAYRQACETLESTEDTRQFDYTMSCLARAREDLASVIATLADEERADRALSIAARVRPADECLSSSEDMDAPTGPRAERALSAYSQAMRTRRFGDLKGALDAMREVEAQARKLQHEPLLIRALIEEGNMMDSLGDPQGAVEPLEEALWRARHSKIDRSIASALTHLTWVEGHALGDVDAGRRRAGEAAAYLERIGGEKPMQAALQINRGTVEFTAGDVEAARAHFERAEQIWREHQPQTVSARYTKALGLSRVLENLGHLSLLVDGEPQEAIGRYSAALDELTGTLGGTHPDLAGLHQGLAEAMTSLGQANEAVAHAKTAVALYTDGYGESHSEVANAYATLAQAQYARNEMDAAAEALAKSANIRLAVGENLDAWASRANLALLLAEAGRVTEARAVIEDADEAVTRLVGAKHEAALAVRLALGRIARIEGRMDDALETYRDLLEVQSEVLEPHDHNLMQVRVDLAYALLETKDFAGVLEVLEPAEALITEHPELDLQLRVRVVLSLAEASAPSDRKRARALAAQAQTMVAGSDDQELRDEAAELVARL